MEVQSKEVDYCKLEVQYKADPDVVEAKRDEVVAELRSEKIPGFRKGKAPDSAIKARLGKQISLHVVRQMKAQAFDDVIFETDVKPIGQPQFDDVSISGNDFSCKITLLKKPDFELKGLKYEVPKPDVGTDIEAETQRSLEDLRLRFGDVEPYSDEDFVEEGDQVTISFEATIDGEAFEGSSSEGQLYVVGQKSLPEFDDNLLGMAAGESRDFEVLFPESYPEIGGKTAQFNVTVNMGTKKVPCALDDELAKQCGEENLDSLKNRLGEVVKARIKQAELIKVQQQVVPRLVDDYDFEVPGVLVELEAQHVALRSGVDWSGLEETEQKVFKEQAEKQVKLSLILDSVREAEPDSVLSDSEAQNGLAKRAQMNGMDPQKFLVEAQQTGRLIGLLAGLKDEYTVQWIVDQAELVE